MIGRAGTGVDNVDLEAATKRGDHRRQRPRVRTRSRPPSTRWRWRWRCSATCRRPTARSSAAPWERSRFGGNELYGKTLGVIGFGRIGQLVARRALAFDMEVIGFDKFVSPERFRDLGVEGVEDSDELYARADLITIHLPKTPDTVNWIDADAIAADEGRRAHRQLRPRRAGRPRRARGRARVRQGRRAPRSTSSPPSRSPSTRCSSATTSSSRRTWAPRPAEAQDRAGHRHGRAGTRGPHRRRGHATRSTSTRRCPSRWCPFVPLCERLGLSGPGPRARARSAGCEAEFRGRIAEHDTRLLGISVLVGVLSGHTEEPVNLVNAPAMAEERGHRAGRDQRHGLGGLHRAGHGPPRLGGTSRSRSRARGSARATTLTCLGLGSALLPALRRPPRGLPLHRHARHDRPRRHRLRRAGREHRLGGGRARRPATTRPSWSSPPTPRSRRDRRQHPRARRLLRGPRGLALAAAP